MVLYDDTLQPCHELTEEGKERYSEYLEQKADEIIFRNQHPLIYLFRFLKDLIQSMGDDSGFQKDE